MNTPGTPRTRHLTRRAATLVACALLSASLPAAARQDPAKVKPAKVPDSWVKARVARAEARLQKTPAGKLVWASIQAHGGLDAWFKQGPITFRFDYHPVKGKRRDSKQIVDTWSSRAVHTVPGTRDQFGWDGKRAWYSSAAARDKHRAFNARFWSLTPFYFVAIPFVMGDDGVILKREGTATWAGRAYDLVRVTYAASTGDAPDDFYVLYIDQKTRRIGAIRYIVTYPGFFPKGKHSPEKFMAYDGAQKVGGVTLAKKLRTFRWDPKAKKPVGEPVTNTTISDVAFRPALPDTTFHMPKGAVIQQKM